MYSETLLHYAKDESHRGKIPDGQIITLYNPHHCGDETTLSLRIEKGIIIALNHTTDGCAVAKAAAAYLCSWLEGKSLQAIQELTKEEVLRALQAEELPTNRHGCLFFALEGLKKELEKNEKK